VIEDPCQLSRRSLLHAAFRTTLGAAIATGLASTLFDHTADAAAQQLAILTIPKIGLRTPLLEGTSPAILDSGVAGHWPGTAPAGSPGDCCVLAHRTSHGGIFRNVHLLNVGDTIMLDNFTYFVTEKLVVRPDQGNEMLGWNPHGPSSGLTLVSCSQQDMQPGSTSYRLLVRAAMTPAVVTPSLPASADTSGIPLPPQSGYISTFRENSETYVIGADGNVYHNYAEGGQWVGWSSLGKPTSGIYGQVAWGSNYLGNQELYVRANDGLVYHLYATPGHGSGWQGWDSMDAPAGGIVGDVCEGTNAVGNQEIYVLGKDGQVHHKYATPGIGSGWSEWGPMGAPTPGIRGDVHEGTNAAGNQELYVVGRDGQVYHTYSTPGAGTGWSAWNSLGGPDGIVGDVIVFAAPGSDETLYVDAGGVTYRNKATPGAGAGWTGWTR